MHTKKYTKFRFTVISANKKLHQPLSNTVFQYKTKYYKYHGYFREVRK